MTVWEWLPWKTNTSCIICFLTWHTHLRSTLQCFDNDCVCDWLLIIQKLPSHIISWPQLLWLSLLDTQYSAAQSNCIQTPLSAYLFNICNVLPCCQVYEVLKRTKCTRAKYSMGKIRISNTRHKSICNQCGFSFHQSIIITIVSPILSNITYCINLWHKSGVLKCRAHKTRG